MKPIAYEGNEPYIFISYAHKDSERVFQVLDELDKKGYRIWYDDGIAPGSEWPEDIARHLDAAKMVIAFVTPHSMASQNCLYRSKTDCSTGSIMRFSSGALSINSI